MMRRFLAAAALLATTVPFMASAGGYTPVCVTVQPGWGWYRVAAEFAPGLTGAARDAFIGRMWGYEEEARITAGELVCIDPNDPALTTTTVSSSSPSTSTTTGPGTSTTTPTTSSTPTSTSSSTSSSAPSTTVSAPTSTLPPTGNGPLPNVPSNFNTAQYIGARPGFEDSTADEPTGNFRTLCRPSHLAHDDPIVNPGTNSAHLHLFFGNTAANRNSTYQTLRTTGQSTCEGGPINRTGYWMPAMFDGQGRVVPPEGIIVYYKATASGGGVSFAQLQADIRSTVQAPNGLRMVTAPGQHMNWRCESGANSGTTIPSSCPAGDDLYASVSFPECWNGRDLDSPDHRSHMAYRSYVDGHLVCPATHPVLIPSISETFWWPDVTGLSQWTLSSDMGAARGSTLHADWFGAWDNPTQTRWHTNCLTGMENSNNGYLCDGFGLSGASHTGTITGTGRISGWTPMSGPTPTTSTTTVRPSSTTAPTGNGRWLFVGDSITAVVVQPSSTVTNVSVGGGSAWSWNESTPNLTGALAAADAQYVVLALGTNDYQPDFEPHYEQLIQEVIAAGRVPVLPRFPWTNGYEPHKEAQILASIDRMLARYPQAIPGPDLYAITVNHPELFRAPRDVHLSPVGEALFRQTWTTFMAHIGH